MQKEFQIKVYKAIKEFYNRHGFSPSIRDLQKMYGYKSDSSIHDHLKSLEKARCIKLHKKTPISIRIL